MKQKLSPDEYATLTGKPVLTAGEAATLMGVSLGCLYRRWREGSGPAYFHVGRARRVRREAVNAWIKKGERHNG